MTWSCRACSPATAPRHRTRCASRTLPRRPRTPRGPPRRRRGASCGAWPLASPYSRRQPRAAPRSRREWPRRRDQPSRSGSRSPVNSNPVSNPECTSALALASRSRTLTELSVSEPVPPVRLKPAFSPIEMYVCPQRSSVRPTSIAGRSDNQLFVNHVAIEPTRHREPARAPPGKGSARRARGARRSRRRDDPWAAKGAAGLFSSRSSCRERRSPGQGRTAPAPPSHG